MPEENEHEMKKSLTAGVGEGGESSSCYALPLGIQEWTGHFFLDGDIWTF